MVFSFILKKIEISSEVSIQSAYEGPFTFNINRFSFYVCGPSQLAEDLKRHQLKD